MVQRNRNLAYAASATVLLGLSFMAWTHQATAQNENAPQPPRGNGLMMMGDGGFGELIRDSVSLRRADNKARPADCDQSLEPENAAQSRELPARHTQSRIGAPRYRRWDH